MFCPSCGAELEIDRRFAHLVVCDFCDSTLLLDGQAARISGKMAALRPPRGLLYRGAEGSLLGRRFRVLGRVRYGYHAGWWEEWFLAFEDGSQAWISEDEESLTLESASSGDGLHLDQEALGPGAFVTLGETSFHVDEKGVATCEGGEGQLPFPVVQGEEVPFLDLSTGKDRFATVEFEPDGLRIFLGRRLRPEEIELDMSREEAGLGAGLATGGFVAEGARERVVIGEGETLGVKCEQCGAPMEVPPGTHESIECSSCGNVLDLTRRRVDCPSCATQLVLRGGEGTDSMVCSNCQSQLDVSEDVPSLLANLSSRKRPHVAFSPGDRGSLRGVDYTVLGHIRWVERDAWGTYVSDEFLLQPDEGEAVWLIQEDGHFSLSRELDERPSRPIPSLQRSSFQFLGKSWTVFESKHPSSGPEITFVDGELPWVAKVGDRCGYVDCIHPPELLTREESAHEVEWYLAEYLPRDEVVEGFGIPEHRLPSPQGIAPHQPFAMATWRRETRWVMLLFGFVFLYLFVASFFQGSIIWSQQVQSSAIEKEYLTTPFTVARDGAVLELELEAPLDNEWCYLDVAVVDEQDRALLDFSAQWSYYHGRDHEGYWTEGRRSTSELFRLDEAGSYRLLVQGQGGSGERSPLRRDLPIQLALYMGAELSRYYFLLFLLCMGWATFEFGRPLAFELQRWGDDDD